MQRCISRSRWASPRGPARRSRHWRGVSRRTGSPRPSDRGHASGRRRAVLAALDANLGIAVTKFIAFAVTGSTSMLAESVHSVADSGNQMLLLLGRRRATRAETEEHPFGFGRERYFYAFVV